MHTLLLRILFGGVGIRRPQRRSCESAFAQLKYRKEDTARSSAVPIAHWHALQRLVQFDDHTHNGATDVRT